MGGDVVTLEDVIAKHGDLPFSQIPGFEKHARAILGPALEEADKILRPLEKKRDELSAAYDALHQKYEASVGAGVVYAIDNILSSTYEENVPLSKLNAPGGALNSLYAEFLLNTHTPQELNALFNASADIKTKGQAEVIFELFGKGRMEIEDAHDRRNGGTTKDDLTLDQVKKLLDGSLSLDSLPADKRGTAERVLNSGEVLKAMEYAEAAYNFNQQGREVYEQYSAAFNHEIKVNLGNGKSVEVPAYWVDEVLRGAVEGDGLLKLRTATNESAGFGSDKIFKAILENIANDLGGNKKLDDTLYAIETAKSAGVNLGSVTAVHSTEEVARSTAYGNIVNAGEKRSL